MSQLVSFLLECDNDLYFKINLNEVMLAYKLQTSLRFYFDIIIEINVLHVIHCQDKLFSHNHLSNLTK